MKTIDTNQNLNQTGERGSIKWIIILIIGIILTSYFFDFSVQDAIEDEQTQSNFGYIKKNLLLFYETYLQTTLKYLWNDIFIDLLWNNFVGNLEAVKNGEATVFDQAAQSQLDILEQKL